jgi:hypothetical protein
VPTLDQERVRSRLLRLSGSSLATGLEDTLGPEKTPEWQLSKRYGFDPKTYTRLIPVLDQVGLYSGSAVSPHLRGSAQRASSLVEREEPH